MRFRYSLLAILVAFMAVMIAPLQAENFKHKDANIQLDVPEGWKTEAAGEVLHITSADGTLYIAFWVCDEADLEAAGKDLDEELDELFDNIKEDGEVEHEELNGLHCITQDGTATVEGDESGWCKAKDVEFSVGVIMSKKPVIVVAFGEKGTWAGNADEIEALFKSIKAIE